jgi:hypothetical protein
MSSSRPRPGISCRLQSAVPEEPARRPAGPGDAVVAQLGQHVEHSRLYADIERTGRLVEDQELRLRCGRALVLAARELVRVAAQELGAEPDLGEERPSQIDGSPLLLTRGLLPQG